ncbi:MAG: hypothetical protein EZS28_002360 [Streblomastix strix]|uniref:Uncharacterized protein n=1 Tax=Streblomastix strix TaxID=222440 RepID=A0A5J4X551_9EUKA|nr:MAG: hypothetical protein EZS28_002360 [Streblomastix strix]
MLLCLDQLSQLDNYHTRQYYRSRTNFNGKETATTALAADIKQATQKCNVSETLKFWLDFSTAQQVVTCSNSLSDFTVNNSVTVVPLESIVQGKRHCGVFIDVPLADVADASVTTAYFYRYPHDITFTGVMDLNYLNPIFNEFPVLTRNYASLYLQLWMTDFLQDLKVLQLKKSRSFDTCLAYAMIPAEKSVIITLLDDSAALKSDYYSVRLINYRDLGNADTDPKTFFPLLMKKIDLIIDQKHATSNPYEALTADVNGSKAIKTYYPNKFMLAWKLATDDLFMRGYNSTRIDGIIDNFKIFNTNPTTRENQNNFAGFIGTRCYLISIQIVQTPLVHLLCDSIVRIMFDDAPEPQTLNLEAIGEIGGSMIMGG